MQCIQVFDGIRASWYEIYIWIVDVEAIAQNLPNNVRQYSRVHMDNKPTIQMYTCVFRYCAYCILYATGYMGYKC